MKKRNCRPKRFGIEIFLITIFLSSCSQIVSSKPIENDCELLKTYLTEGSIDINLAIDNGLDIDESLALIKDAYIYYTKINKQDFNESPNENGIYQKSFAEAISRILEIELPVMNAHTNIIFEDSIWKPALPKYVFISDVFFEKQENDYYVITDNNESIKQGMKYTGNINNIVKEINKNGGISYRFVCFNEYMTSESDICLDGKNITVPVQNKYFYSHMNENIYFEEMPSCLNVGIKTCKMHTQEENENYEVTVKEIASIINNYTNVIIDLRDNNGGYTDLLFPIVEALLLGNDYYLKENDCDNIEKIIDLNSRYLNTKTIRTQIALQGQNASIYNQNIEKKYIDVIESEQTGIKTYTPVFDGNIYIIMNTGTASAPEQFIAILQFFLKDQITLFGQKTYGCLEFGNVMNYRLKDSGVSITLSTVDNRSAVGLKDNQKWHGDTQGFYPDYWCFSNDIDFVELINYLKSGLDD